MINHISPLIFFGVAALAVILSLLFELIKKNKLIKDGKIIQYIDTSGIKSNPPSYIETWQNKTLNIKLSKRYDIKVTHLPALWCLKYLEDFQNTYLYIQQLSQTTSKNRLEESKRQSILIGCYKRLIKYIYNLSKYSVKNRRRYRKELFKRGLMDIVFITDITEQIIDFWKTLKKKLQLQASGETLKSMHGDTCTWSYTSWDGDLRKSVKPRYEDYWKLQMNKKEESNN